MNRNILYLIVGALAVVVAVLGYQYYEANRRYGVEINVNKGGITIEKK